MSNVDSIKNNYLHKYKVCEKSYVLSNWAWNLFAVIFDYKQRLEKSLKDEKEEHQRSKGELESRLTDEKEEHQKVLNENKLRFTSLQQQYKLLDVSLLIVRIYILSQLNVIEATGRFERRVQQNTKPAVKGN